MSYYQPKLDFGESAEALRAADTRIRADRAKAFEAAAQSLGMRPNEVGYKLAGTLAVFVDSPSMRDAGLVGLRWRGTMAELASNKRLNCSADSVAKVLRRFEAAGFVTRAKTVDDRGRVNGIEIELQMKAINAAARGCEQLPTMQSGPVTYPGNGPGSDPGKAASLFIPSYRVNQIQPPPRRDEPKTEAAAVDLDWQATQRELEAVGIKRPRQTIATAKWAGLTPADVDAIVATYNANRSRFNSPGAIVDRIRSGEWAVDLPTAESIERAREHKATKRRGLEFEKARSAVIREAIAAGRWSSLSDAEIDAEAERRIGCEVTR